MIRFHDFFSYFHPFYTSILIHFTAKQIEKAAASKSVTDEKGAKEVKPLIREDDNAPIKLDLQLGSTRNKPDPQVGDTDAQSNTSEKAQKVDRVDEPTGSDQMSPSASDRVLSPKISVIEKSETIAKVQKIIVSVVFLVDVFCYHLGRHFIIRTF